ncbi:MAG: GNAT family N-acetyltransferase [Ruminococcus sp.]|nr:GNAT family N-acetyltransferase [Ruminococcus sp.]
MRLIPFIAGRDFDIIKYWITDERTHAFWSGNRIPYPMERESFEKFFAGLSQQWGDTPFIAADDNGRAVGFLSMALDLASGEMMLKFIVVDPQLRGKGIAQQMLALAVKYAFEIADAGAVQLMVFPENVRAMKCYEKAGFSVRRTDRDAFRFGDELWSRCNMILKRNR